jgi:hypothetical protein
VICFADAGEVRDQNANRHEVGDEFIACIFAKLFVDVGCDVISLAVEGGCKDVASSCIDGACFHIASLADT